MKSAIGPAVLLTVPLLCLGEEARPIFPGAEWEHVAKPESIGYSSAKLEALRGWLKTQVTKGLVVSVGGRILFEYGDVAYPSILASARKSVLGMLYGKYVFNGTIDLRKSVKELGLDDVQKFLPGEEHATLEMLLMSRSGIYHPEGAPDPDAAYSAPARGSQGAGAFFYYNNWDFNAAGTAFEKLTGKNIYEALQTDLAQPIGMQDYDLKRQNKVTDMPYSVHPIYHMWLSTRDMARLGLLMLRHGDWNGKRLIPEQWVEWMTELTTHAGEIFPVPLRDGQTTGPTRWGYGKMWWVWDQPRLPGGAWRSGDFYGAYQAWGMGGQFITVLPMHDMVIAHKVEIEGETAADMPVLEQATLVQMIIAAHCNGACKRDRFDGIILTGRSNTMQITTKGQVTIPQEIRNRLGLLPHTQVEFELAGDHALIRKARSEPGMGERGRRAIEALQGTGDIRMSTDEIMALMRGRPFPAKRRK